MTTMPRKDGKVDYEVMARELFNVLRNKPASDYVAYVQAIHDDGRSQGIDDAADAVSGIDTAEDTQDAQQANEQAWCAIKELKK